MALFMAQFAYTSETWAKLEHAPRDREAASETLLKSLGGRLIDMYFSPGAEYDGVVIFEAPDQATAAAVTIADLAGGHLKVSRITPLLSVEEMQTVFQRAGSAPDIAPR